MYVSVDLEDCEDVFRSDGALFLLFHAQDGATIQLLMHTTGVPIVISVIHETEILAQLISSSEINLWLMMRVDQAKAFDGVSQLIHLMCYTICIPC